MRGRDHPPTSWPSDPRSGSGYSVRTLARDRLEWSIKPAAETRTSQSFFMPSSAGRGCNCHLPAHCSRVMLTRPEPMVRQEEVSCFAYFVLRSLPSRFFRSCHSLPRLNEHLSPSAQLLPRLARK